MSKEHSFQLVIIGGGIVGLATALQLLKQTPHLRLAVIEKESQVGMHQTGHNSGVIHSGIYYRPGSLKAQNCVQGARELLRFCQENEIPYDLCGKVVVATDPEELPRLEELERRGKANGVEGLEMIGPERLREIEPFANGIGALYSPKTGIVDYKRVVQVYAKKVQQLGGEILLNHEVLAIKRHANAISVQTAEQEYRAQSLINCAGLYSDRIASLAGDGAPYQILPFRGEYFDLVPEKHHMLKGLIYPVPNPKFPFLGVHLTRSLSGVVEAGPNAVLAFAREGYRKFDINLQDCLHFLSYRGFWTMAARYWKIGLYEIYRSFSKKTFLKDLQRLMPAIEEKDLIAGGSGVRAQVVLRDGKMCDDFAIVEKQKMIHVLNAPSPGATASLAIGKQIAQMAMRLFGISK